MSNFNQSTASRAVLIEAANVLGAFRDQLVVVGGWVPELLFPDKDHIGSLDVDFAVSPSAVADNAYETIRKRLVDAGYQLHTNPTHFTRIVSGVSEPVKVDLITGQYVTGTKGTSIQLNELRINSLTGLDLAFEACEEVPISGEMPDGTQNTVRVRIVRPEAYILIKAFALDERKKEKDAYDISFVLRNYKPDLATLAERLRPLVTSGLGQKGYEILKAKYALISSVGPAWAAQMVPGTGHDEDLLKRSAFEDAQELFRRVDS